MTTTRLYKDLIGVQMLYSSFTFGGTTYTKFLLDGSQSFSSNFTMSSTLTGIVPPTTTAGLCEDATFIYRKPFEKRVRIEGPVWGNVCFYLENNVTSSYKTVFTEATISLSAISSDGTSRTLINTYEIFPAATGVSDIELVGYGSLRTTSYGIYFTTTCDDIIEPTELLALNLKTYGYKTSSSTTHKYYTRVGLSDADVKISLPLVGV